MKALFKNTILLLSLVMFISLVSCEQRTNDTIANGILQISLSNLESSSSLKSAHSDTLYNDSIPFSSFSLLISVSRQNGEIVFEDKLIPLYRFGTGFVSEQVAMPPGDFLLKKFMVLDNSGQVIYASPLAGSARAYLVNQALPIYFNIDPGQTTQLAPEVLVVEGFAPSDFGYASFTVKVVNPWKFYVLPILMNPDSTFPQAFPEIKLSISTPDNWSAKFILDSGINVLEVRPANSYEVIVYKNGTPEISFSISANELAGTSEDNPYLIQLGGTGLNTLILQPGPDAAVDAMVLDIEPDSNFGQGIYFESTFLPDTFLTVMRTTRGLIAFDLGMLPKSAVIKSVTLTLHYDIPIPWEYDSLWTLRNCNCLWSAATLEQIIEPWEENNVTWNNQPQTTVINQVLMFPFVKNANVIDIDVTSIFVPNPYIDSIPFPNYGMMLKVNPDGSFPGFRFVSGDYPEEYMRPQLTIYYSIP